MTGPVAQRRFPLDAALNFNRITNRDAANLLECSRQTIIRYKHHGIPMFTADKLAIRLNLHPVCIWPDFYDDLEVS